MRICVIGKYPPIEGGVSSRTYWLAKYLGQKGHEVFVVTNALEVPEDYRISLVKEDLPLLEPENVRVFSTKEKISPPIIHSDYFTVKLFSLALDVIRNFEVDVIYSHYLVPYGIVGMMAKQATGKPLIVRHAGSDIGYLYFNPEMKPAIVEVLKCADALVGGGNLSQKLSENDIQKKIMPGFNCVPDEFNPSVEPYFQKDGPVFTFIGKANEMKRVKNFIQAAKNLKGNFYLCFLSGNGPGIDRYQRLINEAGLEKRTEFLPFLPPWKVPSVITASSCVVCPESVETQFYPQGTHYPVISMEAMACGCCVLIGQGVYEKFENRGLKKDFNVFVADTDDIEDFRKCLQLVIDEPEVAKNIGRNALACPQISTSVFADRLEHVMQEIVK